VLPFTVASENLFLSIPNFKRKKLLQSNKLKPKGRYGEMKKSLYLPELFKANKRLFTLVLLFFGVNIAFNTFFISEITPVYQWAMYARPIKDEAYHSFVTVRYNGNKVLRFKHTWQEYQKLLLANTMNRFIFLQTGHTDPVQDHFTKSWLPRHRAFVKAFPHFRNYNSPEQLQAFPQWYKRYLAHVVNEEVRDINIYLTTVSFLPDGSVQEHRSTLVYHIP
jgi:hypothetical protein